MTQKAMNYFDTACREITDRNSKHYHSVKREHLDTLRWIAYSTFKDKTYGMFPITVWLERTYLSHRNTFTNHCNALEEAGLIRRQHYFDKSKRQHIVRIDVLNRFKSKKAKNSKTVDLDRYREEREGQERILEPNLESPISVMTYLNQKYGIVKNFDPDDFKIELERLVKNGEKDAFACQCEWDDWKDGFRKRHIA